MKRKIASILFCFFLIAPVVITFTFFHFEKKQIKRTVKWKMIDGIDKSELVFFKFSKSETETVLNWKHSKEFSYQGEMYDIVEKKNEGDSIAYWCWWDHQETALNKKLDVLLAKITGNNSPNSKKKDQILNVYKKLFHDTAEIKAERPTFSVRPVYYYQENFSLVHYPPTSPPPQLS